MGILLDIGFVIIILLCVVFGYKKGFFKSIASFIGAVIAMFLAWVLAGLIANALYQGIFREKLIDHISAVLSNDALASFPEKAAQVVANLPGFLSNTLNNQGITSSQIEQSLQAAGNNAAPATADLISPAVIWLLQLLLTVILFFILVILVRLVIKLIGNVFRLPVLRQVDGILGGLFGIFKGVVYIFLVCILLQLLMPVIGNSSEPMKQVLDNSFIYQFIFYNNPITSWFI
ncbi:MAG: CvpA family protein [Clostridium sp.]|nr:CvpA family protein [Clostridium sp.]